MLAVWASLILTVDLFVERSKSAHRLMLVLSLVGVLLAMVATLALAGQNTTAFFGTVVVDNFAVFFKVIFLLAAGLVLLSAESLIERVGENAAEFCGLILFCTAGLMFMASGYELMTIYLALEISSLSLAFLAAWNKRELRSSEAGLKFFVLSAVSSGILLFGMALLYGITGSTSLREIGRLLTTADGRARRRCWRCRCWWRASGSRSRRCRSRCGRLTSTRARRRRSRRSCRWPRRRPASRW